MAAILGRSQLPQRVVGRLVQLSRELQHRRGVYRTRLARRQFPGSTAASDSERSYVTCISRASLARVQRDAYCTCCFECWTPGAIRAIWRDRRGHVCNRIWREQHGALQSIGRVGSQAWPICRDDEVKSTREEGDVRRIGCPRRWRPVRAERRSDWTIRLWPYVME